jgi:hypothetical protein
MCKRLVNDKLTRYGNFNDVICVFINDLATEHAHINDVNKKMTVSLRKS